MSFEHKGIKYFIKFKKETIVVHYYCRKIICPDTRYQVEDYDFCRDY